MEVERKASEMVPEQLPSKSESRNCLLLLSNKQVHRDAYG